MLEFIQIPKRDFHEVGITAYNTWFGTSFVILDKGNFCIFDSLARMEGIEASYVEKHGLVYIDVEVPVFYA
jgi:hypothetical protein